MPTGTTGDDRWDVRRYGEVAVYDGRSGVDTLSFDRLSRSDFTIVKNSDGSVSVDSVAGASALYQLKLIDVEILLFEFDSVRIDLRTFFDSQGILRMGSVGNDTLVGTDGPDTINGGGGQDVIQGGLGRDVAAYTGALTDYTVTIDRAQRTATVQDKAPSRDGTDNLSNIEVLRFAGVDFDLFNPARTRQPQYNTDGTFLLDPAFYLLSNKTQVPSLTLQNAAEHYLKSGAAQGLKPNAWFDPSYYSNRWPDLKVLNLSPDVLFLHYNLYGVWEGRSAGPVFDTFDGNRYLRDNPDVAAYVDAYVKDFLGSRTNGAIAHYIIYGAAEGRKGFDSANQEVSPVIIIGVSTGPGG